MLLPLCAWWITVSPAPSASESAVLNDRLAGDIPLLVERPRPDNKTLSSGDLFVIKPRPGLDRYTSTRSPRACTLLDSPKHAQTARTTGVPLHSTELWGYACFPPSRFDDLSNPLHRQLDLQGAYTISSLGEGWQDSPHNDARRSCRLAGPDLLTSTRRLQRRQPRPKARTWRALPQGLLDYAQSHGQ